MRYVLLPASVNVHEFTARHVPPRYKVSDPAVRCDGMHALGRRRSMRRAAKVAASAERWPRVIIRVTRAAVVTSPSRPTVSTMI